MKKGRTKDESFIVALYQEAHKQTDHTRFYDPYAIGKSIGLQQTAVNTICVLLGQANFIKKNGNKEIAITKHGITLAEDILQG
jgi:hypothetical protein